MRKPGMDANSQEEPSRREFLRGGAVTGIAAAIAPVSGFGGGGGSMASPANTPPFELAETTVADLQRGMESGKYAARSIAELYLRRIEAIDRNGPTLRSIIETNPDALAIADALDRERKAKGPRGPLHGIPVLIKDNIDTADGMMTTAGSLALVGPRPLKDSFVAQRLREAGAVLLAKTNPSEWANIRSSHSTSGWSGRGGQTKNPYALDRNPSGSSSGSGAGVSANLGAIAIGTETDGSIVSPSSSNGVVGIKPTVGLVSRTGIIPISHSQDTAGPMCRTVRDAAILLGAMAGGPAGIDPEDIATLASGRKAYSDYTQFLQADGLRGARIGVVRGYFGFSEKVDPLMEQTLEVLRKQGATVVDPANIETLNKTGANEELVLQYELKADLNAYLARRGAGAAVHTLKEIIGFNERERDKEMPYFGQDFFLKAQQLGSLDTQEYKDAHANNLRLSRTEGIDATMDKFKLDALFAPTGGPAGLTDLVNGDSGGGGSSSAAAIAGYPSITVPAGFLFGLPVGVSFFGRAWSEPTLIKLAYSFEQATRVRREPKFLPTADLRL